MLEEYFKLASFVQAYDSYFLTIKTWGVTVTGTAMGVGFSKDLIAQDGQILIFVIALVLATAFWFTEVRFKLIQMAHVFRQSALERALQNETHIKYPGLLESYGDRSMVNKEQKRWRTIMFWPHVMFPHIIFVVLSLCLIAIRIVRMLRWG
jgi:hypothetical protein